jgi:Ca-activated chloride channel family protein
LVVTVVIVFIWARAHRRRTKWRRLAMVELGAVKQHYDTHQNDQWVVQRLSEIVRRNAMANFPRTEVAGLVGSSWLGFLDRTGRTNQFTEGVGHLLSSGPYRPQAAVPAADLLILVEHWIQHVAPPTRRNTA